MVKDRQDGAETPIVPTDVDFHVVTVTQFFHILRGINDALADLRTGDDETGKSLRTTASELRKTYQMVAEEKARMDAAAAKTGAAGASEETFDADAIRRQLAERLARLGVRGAEDGVSGEPD
ncbi:hypothetical protein [Maritimibacter sp. DP1N21-5]|uniref:hypothetical protein n=1 Tax=Maritimibacter sp. DP1N21-5 TaxID=2836867 RepID=UPI001C43938D|nr:hypothetical protein [Maritimibacter sp. DP1N21-5]MBV7410176.1 hypothetical protein [Maritimibacter sp. DP1N21-5]